MINPYNLAFSVDYHPTLIGGWNMKILTSFISVASFLCFEVSANFLCIFLIFCFHILQSSQCFFMVVELTTISSFKISFIPIMASYFIWSYVVCYWFVFLQQGSNIFFYCQIHLNFGLLFFRYSNQSSFSSSLSCIILSISASSLSIS